MFVAIGAIPFIWIRSFDLQAMLPPEAAFAIAVRSCSSAGTGATASPTPCRSCGGSTPCTIARFIHANVRLRFPGLAWVTNTPEWHHCHHASDPEARDKNFGLPAIDKLFGTAYLPSDKHPAGFGIDDPVPANTYLGHLAYPFTRAANGRVEVGSVSRGSAPPR